MTYAIKKLYKEKIIYSKYMAKDSATYPTFDYIIKNINSSYGINEEEV